MDIFGRAKKQPVLDVVSGFAFNDVYFGDDGLTSASANHVAAMATLYANRQKEASKCLRLYQKSIRVIGEEECVVEESNNILDKIPAYIKNISKANALVAWLREAIKTKADCLEHIGSTMVAEWAEKNGRTVPERPAEPKRPVVNFDDVKDVLGAGLTIKEYNRYIELCSTLAVYGEYIHEKGLVTQNIAKLELYMRNPKDVKENGRDTIITTYTPAVNPVDVYKAYNNLQAEYRKLQAEKNGIEAKFNDLATIYQLNKKAQYEKDVEAWKSKLQEYNTDMSELTLAMNKWKQETSDRISALKIVIPNDLKEIYSKVME